MKRTLLMALMVLAVALTTAQPSFAATTWELNIHNNTEEPVGIKLDGETNDYHWTAEVGKTYKTVVEGTYTYSYTYCSGDKVSGEITVDSNNVWLTVALCGAPIEYDKFIVESRLPGTITVELVGPQTYALTAEIGSNKFMSPGLQTGLYFFSFDACGTTFTGEVLIKRDGPNKLILYACEQVANHPYDPVSILNTQSNLRIGSHYAFPVRITLLGPKTAGGLALNNYSFELLLGLNRFNIAPGEYSYFYTAYGVTKSGVFSVSSEGPTNFTISPLY
ncbi:MAG: hypothetical protein ACRDFQ_00135 [Anaerolineales bacterium]